MSQSIARLVTVSPDVLCQHVEGNAVLLNLATDRYHSLDDVGTRMWDALSADGDVERMVAELLTVYDIDEPRLRSDVHALLGALASAGLVTLEA